MRGALGILVALGALLALPGQAVAGSFHVQCGFSHRLADDPIVHPGHEGMAHWHDFFGGRDAAADSTYRSMLRGGTTCGDELDTAGYWHPRLRADGQIERGVLTAYYSRGGKPTVRPFPPDLRIVAGSAKATAPQWRHVLYWRCAGPGETARSTTVPRCTDRQRLTANVRFPDCWDGRRLDSTDHVSHMRYNRGGACPATHPVPVPELMMSIAFDARPRGGAQVQLSSGRAFTMHADFWNTWHQLRLRALTNECLNLDVDCGDVGR